MDLQLEKLHEYFLRSSKTLALAESCTGGLLSSQICCRPGVSAYFLGSVVSYAGSAKQNILGVKNSALACHGEVSIPVAREMARGAKKLFKSDYAVSITGIAGPAGGTPDKPVGTVCFAALGPGFEEAVTQHFEVGSREQIQLASAQFALQFFWDSIHK